jgi:tRNA (guanine-N7-)-methyltransferase
MRETDFPELIFRPASIVQPLPLDELFPSRQPLEVELGAGDGSFLAAYAKARPDHNFIGLERLLGRLRKIERKGKRAGLTNLRLLRLEAAYFVQYLLEPGSVAGFHIYFPDPWPKRRHWKNRLINETFTHLLHRALAPQGIVYLRTDDAHYFDQMLRSFEANAGFEKMETPTELLAFQTDFERGFQQRGVPTRHAAYRKKTTDSL